MKRKDFLRNSLGLIGIGTVLADSCKKDDGQIMNAISSEKLMAADEDEFATSCVVTPAEKEGPYPYPGGEKNNPLNRVDIREDRTGILLHHTFTVVNTHASCAVVPNAKIDIWHCDKNGYYSGYANQPGYLGTKSYVGATWLRGYQYTDSNGQATFTTIFPGWYVGRATHIHIEAFINNVLKRTMQIAFTDSITRQVYNTRRYKAQGQNPTNNSNDGTFGDSSADLAKEITHITRNKNTLYGSFTIGLAL